MPSLKDLKNRIDSVKKTQKITSAMKMVAAAKLKRAQDQAEAARPYGDRMARVLGSVAAKSKGSSSKLMAGTGKDDTHLILLMTSDRGLCGGFNANLIKKARILLAKLQGEGKTVKMITVGRRARDAFRREMGENLLGTTLDIDKPKLDFAKAADIATDIQRRFEDGEFDTCTFIYSRFKSVISQTPTAKQLIPFVADEDEGEAVEEVSANTSYEYEPDEAEILNELLPRNIGIQIYTALLENAASEHGARMTAMDNATRNAGDMIHKLTRIYNRTRQAQITTELIEIVAGAEAL